MSRAPDRARLPPGSTYGGGNVKARGPPRPAGASTAHHLLARLREWWRRRSELETVDPEELARVAKGNLGMTGRELKDLAACGPDAAHLLG